MIGLWILAAIATAPTCGEPSVDVQFWSTPNRNVICKELDYHECLTAIEAEALRRRGDDVRRVGDALIFKTADGELLLEDKNTAKGASRSEVLYHDYWGWSGEFHLLRLQFYEGQWYALMHAATGHITRIHAGGIPALSPDGEWAASVDTQLSPHNISSIRLWKRQKDGFQLFQKTRVRTPMKGEVRASWVSSEAIQVCASGEEPALVGYLRFRDDGWELGETGDAVMAN